MIGEHFTETPNKVEINHVRINRAQPVIFSATGDLGHS